MAPAAVGNLRLGRIVRSQSFARFFPFPPSTGIAFAAPVSSTGRVPSGFCASPLGQEQLHWIDFSQPFAVHIAKTLCRHLHSPASASLVYLRVFPFSYLSV